MPRGMAVQHQAVPCTSSCSLPSYNHLSAPEVCSDCSTEQLGADKLRLHGSEPRREKHHPLMYEQSSRTADR